MFQLPKTMIRLLQFYLERCRPLLCGSEYRFLFPGCGGAAKLAGNFAKQVVERLEHDLGIAMRMHLFRACVAPTIAEHAPEHSGIIARILGHQTLQTAYAHYIHTGTARAARAHQAHIAALRSREAEQGA